MDKDRSGPPIETKLQVTELSLLPPNSKGFMPSGVQRFPFEFPVPSTLPTSVFIPDRLEIFYQLTATLRLSKAKPHETATKNNWIDWALRNSSKNKYVATTPMRIIRAMESIVSHGLPTSDAHDSTPSLTAVVTQTEDDSQPMIEASTANEVTSTGVPAQLPWNRRGLDGYQGTLDEQHDQLAFSLSGRTSGNFNQPIHMLEETQGIRYKLGVDRTAIAIGTSIGIELMIEPTFADAFIKSVLLKVSENRKYVVKIPSNHVYSTASEYQTKTYNEGAKMVMKWAFGYEVENEEGELVQNKKNITRQISKPADKYIRERSSSSQFLAYFDPPQLGHMNNKFFLGNHPDNKPTIYLDNQEDVQENNNIGSPSTSPTAEKNDLHDILNLKELNQSVRVGEYFGGRFVMPMPDCAGILNPSMEYETININHWLQLVVVIECNGKEFELRLDSPSRMLDCRVVSVDDDRQTILPPPPSYEPGDGFTAHDWSTGTFWEQREPITSVSNWGSKVLCPCETKKRDALNKNRVFAASGKHNNISKDKMAVIPTPPNLLPEWGAPPAYDGHCQQPNL